MQRNYEYQITSSIHSEFLFVSDQTIMSFDDFKKKIKYLLFYLEAHNEIRSLILNLIKEGSIKVIFCDLKQCRATWSKDLRVIKIKLDLDNVKTLDSLVFELCNASNKEINNIEYRDYDSSEKYAESIELIEYKSSELRYALVTQGVTQYNWPPELPSLKYFKPFSLEDCKRRSVVYNGYSHFHLNMKFHNDYMLYLAVKKLNELNSSTNLFDEGMKLKLMSEIDERKKLQLELDYHAKRDFPATVIRHMQDKNLVGSPNYQRYLAELEHIELWYKEMELNITSQSARQPMM